MPFLVDHQTIHNNLVLLSTIHYGIHILPGHKALVKACRTLLTIFAFCGSVMKMDRPSLVIFPQRNTFALPHLYALIESSSNRNSKGIQTKWNITLSLIADYLCIGPRYLIIILGSRVVIIAGFSTLPYSSCSF